MESRRWFVQYPEGMVKEGESETLKQRLEDETGHTVTVVKEDGHYFFIMGKEIKREVGFTLPLGI